MNELGEKAREFDQMAVSEPDQLYVVLLYLHAVSFSPAYVRRLHTSRNESSDYDMEKFIDKRWKETAYDEKEEDEDLDNSSARLFERSRIKALAGRESRIQ